MINRCSYTNRRRAFRPGKRQFSRQKGRQRSTPKGITADVREAPDNYQCRWVGPRLFRPGLIGGKPDPAQSEYGYFAGEKGGSTDRWSYSLTHLGFVLVPSSCPTTPDQFSPVSRKELPRVPRPFTPCPQLRISPFWPTKNPVLPTDWVLLLPGERCPPTMLWSPRLTPSGLSRRVTTYSPGLYRSAPVETFVRYPSHSTRSGERRRRAGTLSPGRSLPHGVVPVIGIRLVPGPCPVRLSSNVSSSMPTRALRCSTPGRGGPSPLPIAGRRGEVGPIPGRRCYHLLDYSGVLSKVYARVRTYLSSDALPYRGVHFPHQHEFRGPTSIVGRSDVLKNSWILGKWQDKY
jgi:hypothetical protein